MKCGWYRVTIKVSKWAPVYGGYGETWLGSNLGKEELGFKRAQHIDSEGGGANGFSVHGRKGETERILGKTNHAMN